GGGLSQLFVMFEAQIQSYQGDDPLDPWDRYLQWVESAFPLQSGQECLSASLEQLVKVFISEERYHQDPRFVKYCIKLAEFISAPSQFFDYIYSQGVGTRTSALYIAWAQQLETEGNIQHAGAVLQKGIHNQAEPMENLQEQYRVGLQCLIFEDTRGQELKNIRTAILVQTKGPSSPVSCLPIVPNARCPRGNEQVIIK
uniref:BUB1 N-terminal domain-containing protein n=1 Tax=Terrapene triunguis TaxID=2587831 RepID=A0A674IAC4_9SAUR